ncbi:hypothetical protein FJZ31_28435 [Candidatus Poribacteria bacterium]|nr:hypothetical protein [Candidatus Poribacteria bacterium]
MRKFSFLAFALVVGLVLTTSYIISAQQRGGGQQVPGQGQQRRQMDPEAMMNQRVEQIMKQLNLSNEETAVLKPKIEGILQTRMTQNREMRTLIDALQKAVEAKDDAQIQAKLTEVKTKRKEHKAKVETLEQELIELLTLNQEATLTISGVVNSDGAGGFFGGFTGQRQQPPGQRQQRSGRGQQ